MANNMEAYCDHCREITMFILESDLLWHCDECGKILESIPEDEFEDFEDEIDRTVIRCPSCGCIFGLDEVVETQDGIECPICFDEITDYMLEKGYYDEKEDEEWF